MAIIENRSRKQCVESAMNRPNCLNSGWGLKTRKRTRLRRHMVRQKSPRNNPLYELEQSTLNSWRDESLAQSIASSPRRIFCSRIILERNKNYDQLFLFENVNFFYCLLFIKIHSNVCPNNVENRRSYQRVFNEEWIQKGRGICNESSQENSPTAYNTAVVVCYWMGVIF